MITDLSGSVKQPFRHVERLLLRKMLDFGVLPYDKVVAGENVLFLANPYYPLMTKDSAEAQSYPDYGDFRRNLEELFLRTDKKLVDVILMEEYGCKSPESGWLDNGEYLHIPDNLSYYKKFGYAHIPVLPFSCEVNLGYNPFFPKMPFAKKIYVAGVENGDIQHLIRDLKAYEKYIDKPKVLLVLDLCLFPNGSAGLSGLAEELSKQGASVEMTHSGYLPILRKKAA